MNLRKQTILLFLVFFVPACIFTSGCSQKQKVYHVGILSGFDYFYTITDGFKEKMAELGYTEGKNIFYDVQKTNVDIAAYRAILKKFVADKVDLIFVFPTEASMEAKSVTQGTGIPVVFANVFTEGTNLVNSIREPGGNMTGVRWPGPDLALERFEIMHELLPLAKKMWVPYLKYPTVNSQLETLRQTFKAAGVTMIEIPVTNAAEIESAMKKQAQLTGPPDAILTIVEPLANMPDAFVIMAEFADKYKIPIGGAYMSIKGYESVFGIIPQNIPQGRQAAFLADKILKGVPAGTIPVVSAESYFQFNYKAAKKLGLKVDEGLLSKANEIIR